MIQYRPYSHPSVYGTSSMNRLETCDERIQHLFKALAEEGWDISIICGHRSHEKQQLFYDQGFSNAKPGESGHNDYPSTAIDAGPWISGYGIPWSEGDNIWIVFAGIVLAKAAALNIPLKWGGLFRSIKDLNHFELVL